MIRGRAWRRYMQEKIVTRRLKRSYHFFWRGFIDINGISHHNPTISAYIGKDEYFTAKTQSTTKCDSDHKIKYSPNKNKNYWRDGEETREKHKKLFISILKENGLK